MSKVKIMLYVTPQQHERLRAEALHTGLAVSELVRRAIDNHLPAPRQERTMTTDEWIARMEAGFAGLSSAGVPQREIVEDVIAAGLTRADVAAWRGGQITENLAHATEAAGAVLDAPSLTVFDLEIAGPWNTAKITGFEVALPHRLGTASCAKYTGRTPRPTTTEETR